MPHTCRPYVHKPRATPATTYGPADIAKAYNFPTNLPPGGVVAIIELGGGYVASDIATFCEKYGIALPTLVDVPCDSKNSPGTDADVEVALDIEIAAGVYSFCTGGVAAQIRIYWATDIAPAVAKIVADKQAGIPIAAVSISWGAPEDQWTAPQTPQFEDAALAALAPLGIPFFAAAGDNDSGDGDSTPGNHVDFPASSPHATACGGTSKPASGVETVWNDGPGEGTGGGYSAVFPSQAWQVGAPPPPVANPPLGRMVPDVAANADPQTGYEIFCASQGGWQVVGGTSAVAPLFAGLFAAINPPSALLEQNADHAGAGNTIVWANAAAFVDVTQGSNGAYSAAVGPDPCTGVGVPDGMKVAAMFAAGGSGQGVGTGSGSAAASGSGTVGSGSGTSEPQPPATGSGTGTGTGSGQPIEPPQPPDQPPGGDPDHHRHHPGHGGDNHGGDHHGGHDGNGHSPVWWHCTPHHTHGHSVKPTNILAANERDARRKFLKSFGARASEHESKIGVHKLPVTFKPCEADLELEKRLAGDGK